MRTRVRRSRALSLDQALHPVLVRRVRRQVQQFPTSNLDALTHAVGLVCAEAIHHHHITRSQAAVQVGEENVDVGGLLNSPCRDDAPGAQGT